MNRIGKGKEQLRTIKSSKIKYLGIIMRGNKRYGLLQLILQEKTDGRTGPGRIRILAKEPEDMVLFRREQRRR